MPALSLVLAGCIPNAEPPAPAPAPTPAPAPAPAPAPEQPPLVGDWREWPVTPGDWVYRQDDRGSIALFGESGEDAQFTIRCDRARDVIYLSRQGGAGGRRSMTIRTTSQDRTLTAQPTGGTPAYVAAALGADDRLLDAMGFSRGRFVVEVQDMPTLVIPSWAEVLRVTEDCRD